jgi:hypothetical protein
MDQILATPQRDNMLSCFITRDPGTQMYISHCLNHDLMECGKTSKEAWENLKIVIKRNLENPSPGLVGRQAKKECWDAFGEAIQRDPSNLKMETIEIQVSAPLPASDVELWLQQFTLEGMLHERSFCSSTRAHV